MSAQSTTHKPPTKPQRHWLLAILLLAVGGLVMGVLSYPFAYPAQAFGPHDNPFEDPLELVRIIGLAKWWFLGFLLLFATRQGYRRWVD